MKNLLLYHYKNIKEKNGRELATDVNLTRNQHNYNPVQSIPKCFFIKDRPTKKWISRPDLGITWVFWFIENPTDTYSEKYILLQKRISFETEIFPDLI